MRHVVIQDFGLSTAVDYRRPVTFAEAELDLVAKALTDSPCGEHIVPSDISLDRQNELFSYSLSVPLFSGVGNITINAQGTTVLFKQGKTSEHLQLMAELTFTALKLSNKEEVKRSVVAFNVHVVFKTETDFKEHMSRFTELSENIRSGGTVLVVDIPDIKGELRYVSEKSLAHAHGLFIAVNATIEGDVSGEVFDRLAQEFKAVAALEKLTFD